MCQQAPHPLLLSNYQPPETPPDAGAAWVWFAFSWGQKKKGAKLEHFLGDPHASPLTPAIWTSFSWACVREGWMGLRCHALAHGHILVLSQ